MAKKNDKKQAFSFQGFDSQHLKRTEGYVQAIDALYSQAVNEFALVASKVGVKPDKLFSFADYPQTKAKAESIISGLANKMEAVITTGSREEWLYACKKNDAFLNSILSTSKVPKATLERWQNKNLEALSTFQTRKVNGLGLSDRIWNYTGQMKTQMELGIDIAMGEGKSAAKLSRDLRQYLVDPDKLFHKVRNKHGNLVLSKNAAAFHPGQGKYRSSYKNAMRLTRSEINMAYRESDQLRWEKLDFVVGFEVKLSNNHTLNGVPFVDICDNLKGKYPKEFKFKGWHPQCRCHAVPIMQDTDEFDTDELNELTAAINGTEYNKLVSKNTVNDVPQNFKSWVADNAERSKGWKSQPYFIKDNFKGGIISGGIKLDKVAPKSVVSAVPQQSKIEPIISKLEKANVEYNDPKYFEKDLTESEIIERLGGGDMTKGSCSSLAFAYAGNKAGFDVLDFRDGMSRFIISKQDFIMEVAEKVGGVVTSNTNDFKKAVELLKTVSEGKEYYFTCGKHASIVRKRGGVYEYLELQSKNENGFKTLTNDALKKRFAATQTHSFGGKKFETKDCIIDISLLKNEAGFKKFLGYINTAVGNQKKGALGSIK